MDSASCNYMPFLEKLIRKHLKIITKKHLDSPGTQRVCAKIKLAASIKFHNNDLTNSYPYIYFITSIIVPLSRLKNTQLQTFPNFKFCTCLEVFFRNWICIVPHLPEVAIKLKRICCLRCFFAIIAAKFIR